MPNEPISGNTPGAQQMMDGGQRTAMPPQPIELSPSEQPVIEAPQQPPQPQAPIELEEPVQSPTAISTDSMRQTLDQAQQRLQQLKAEQEAAAQAQAQVQTEPEQPKTQGEPSPTSFIDEYTRETNNILKQRQREFDRYLTRSDNLLRSQVRSIQKTFDERRQQAENVAANAKAATNVLGARTGRLRYAPEIQRGIITGQENALIETLSTIDAQEAAAIAAAEEAAFSRDYDTFLDKIDSLDGIRKERETVLNELQEAMKLENEERQAEAERLRHDTLVIEQFANGVTDPVEIFKATNGEVPYDVIVEYTTTLPKPVSTEPIKLGSADLLVNPQTGEVIARGSKVGGVSGGTSVGNAVGFGNSPVTVGAPTIAGLGATYETSSTDAQLIIDDIVNGLPTQLINNVAEIPRWREAVRKQLNAGYQPQEVIDKLSGFRLFDSADRNLGNVLYNMATGTDLEPQALSTLINRGATEQAMTTVENAQLKNVNAFFASTDKARATIAQAETVLNLLNDPEFPKEKLGAFDGRSFKVGRFTNLTGPEGLKVQQLESALQLLNAPIRVEIVGTAATEAEMSKITGFQADILDQPDIVESMVTDLRDAVLRFHNEARSQRGLPQVDRTQVLNNNKRLELYRSLGKQEQQAVSSTLSNKDLLTGGVTPAQSGSQTSVPTALEGL